MAFVPRLSEADRQRILKADPLVLEFSATCVSCKPCSSTIKLTTSYGLPKWRNHCKRVHGRSDEVTSAMEASVLANPTATPERDSDTSMNEPSDGEDELDVIERTPAPPMSPPRNMNDGQRRRVLELDPEVLKLKPTAAQCRTCKKPVFFIKATHDLSAWTAHGESQHGRSPVDVDMLKLQVIAEAQAAGSSPSPRRRPVPQSASTTQSPSRTHREVGLQFQSPQTSKSPRRLVQRTSTRNTAGHLQDDSTESATANQDGEDMFPPLHLSEEPAATGSAVAAINSAEYSGKTSGVDATNEEDDDSPSEVDAPRLPAARLSQPRPQQKLIVDERIRFYGLDTLAGAITPSTVYCTVCNKNIQLSKSTKHDLHKWDMHCKKMHKRTEEEIMQLRQQAVASGKGGHDHEVAAEDEPHQDGERVETVAGRGDRDEDTGEVDELESDVAPQDAVQPRQRRKRKSRQSTGDRMMLDQRIRMLALDPLAGVTTPTSVDCTQCGKTIQLNKRLKYDIHSWKAHCRNVHKRSDEEAELLKQQAADGDLHENGHYEKLASGEQHLDLDLTVANEEERGSQDHDGAQDDDELGHSSTAEDHVDRKNTGVDSEASGTKPASLTHEEKAVTKPAAAAKRRRRILELDDLLGEIEPKRVWCIPCAEWRLLDKRCDYSFQPWIQHSTTHHGRTKADFANLTQRAAAEIERVEEPRHEQQPEHSGNSVEEASESDELSPQANVTNDSNNDAPALRLAFLRCDPLAGDRKERAVFCVECRKWIQTRGTLANWHRHCAAMGTHRRSRKETLRIERQALASLATPAAPSSSQVRDNPSPPASVSTTAPSETRNSFLELDPLVSHYTSKEVHCKVCGPIRIHGLYTFEALRFWHDHCRTAVHGRTKEEIERLRLEAWPDAAGGDGERSARIDLNPASARNTGESLEDTPTVDDDEAVNAPMPKTRRSRRSTATNIPHGSSYTCETCGKKVLSVERETHEAFCTYGDEEDMGPSGNVEDDERSADDETAGDDGGDHDAEDDDDEDDSTHPVSSDQLDRDPRVRDYDESMVQCFGEGHWIERDDWKDHAENCETLFAELTKQRQDQRKKHRNTLPPRRGKLDPLKEWDYEEIRHDPRVMEFTVNDICCDSCHHRIRRAPRFKWEDHRVDCRIIQRRIRLGELEAEEDDLINSSFLRFRDEDESDEDDQSDSASPPAPPPRRRQSQMRRSSMTSQPEDKGEASVAEQASGHESEDAAVERPAAASNEEQLQAARLPSSDLVFGRGLPSMVKHTAGLIEFDLDPLAKELKDRRVECIECNRTIVRDKWRRHCAGVHQRTVEEQNQIIMNARAAALRGSTTPASTNLLSPAAPITLRPEGQRGEGKRQAARGVHHPRLRTATADINSDEDIMEIDKPSTSSNRLAASIMTTPETVRSLSIFDVHDTALQQRLLIHDPLAKALDVKARNVECKECQRKFSVKWRGDTCSLQFWNRHCESAHSRTAAETQRVMQLVAIVVDPSATEHMAVNRGTKRPAQARSDMPVPKRLRFSTPDMEKSVSPIRARTGGRTQCDQCGKWLKSVNFESHVGTRCQKRPVAPLHLAPQVAVRPNSPRFDSPSPPPTLAAAPSIDPAAASQSHNLADYAGVTADDESKRQAAFLFFLWTHNALAKIAYMKRQRELEEEAALQ